MIRINDNNENQNISFSGGTKLFRLYPAGLLFRRTAKRPQAVPADGIR